MDTTLTFEQAAAIVGTGLNLDLFDREQVIAWADLRIAEISAPPPWLLQLATSRKLSYYEAAKLVLQGVPPASTELTAGVLLALMPPLESIPDESLQRVGRFIYCLVRDISNCDWTQPILYKADEISDSFALLESGYLPNESLATMRMALIDYFETFSLPQAAPALSPVQVLLSL